MPVNFSRTLRSLEQDRFPPALIGTLLAVLLGLAWMAWMVLARVSVYEVSSEARVEVAAIARPLEAPVGGKVFGVSLEVGKTVVAGEALVVLETAPEESRLAEEQAHLTGLGRRLEQLRAAQAATEEAHESAGAADRAAVARSRAERDQAEAALRLAEADLRRAESLHALQLLSVAELEKAEATADERRAALEASERELTRGEWVKRQNDSQRQALRADGEHEIATLEEETAVASAALPGLEHELGLRFLRAPISGVLAEAAPLTIGAVVEPGDRIATVAPDGQLRAVAQFLAASAVGRIRPGQAAHMEIHAYPWVQYGRLQAHVTGVGSEPTAGQVRVELAFDENPNPAIRLQHGLTGVVAVEVERVSPAALIVRAAGSRRDRPAAGG